MFVGPPPDAIEAMGSKIGARRLMQQAGVPVIPGTPDPVEPRRGALEVAEGIGYPVAVKAAAGGGGKGIEVAAGAGRAAPRAYESARRQGKAYFADDTVFLERYLDDPRHVEVQVLADAHGNVIHLGERDCSIQRRHQKIIEETPSPAVDAELRERIGADRRGRRARGRLRQRRHRRGPAVGRRSYFFLEMNTRLQVEHTITEEVTGLDLVREQLRIACRRAAVAAPGGGRAARPLDPVPDQRRGSAPRLRADAGPDHPLPRAVRPGRAGRLRAWSRAP